MALQKQNVSIRVGGGLAEDVDEFLLESPAALQVSNARFSKAGKVGKRYGTAALSASGSYSSVAGTATIMENGGSLFQTHPDGSIVLDEAASTPAWRALNISSPRPSRTLSDPLVRGNSTMSCADMAIIGDLMLCTWEDETSSSVGYAFFNASTRALLGAPGVLDSSDYITPKVISTGIYFVVVAKRTSDDTAQAWVYTSTADTYTITDSPTTLTTVNDWRWDISRCAADNTMVISRLTGVGNDTEIRQYSVPALSFVTNATQTSFQGVSLTYNSGIDKLVMGDPGGYIGYTDADLSPTTFTVTSQLIVPNVGLTDVSEVEVVQRDSAGGMWFCIGGTNTTVHPSGSYAPSLQIRRITAAFATSGSSEDFGVRLAARGCYLGSTLNDCLLIVWNGIDYDTANTGTTATWADIVMPAFDEDSGVTLIPVGTALRDKVDKTTDGEDNTHGATSFHSHLGHSMVYGDDVMCALTTLVDDRGNSAFTGAVRRQVDLVRCNHNAPPAQRSVSTQGVRVIADGSGASCIDGARHGELTPPLPSQMVMGSTDTDGGLSMAVASIPVAGPSGTSATYHYIRAHWRWVDAQGNVHRGPPSPQIQFSPDDLAVGAVAGNVGARRVKLPKPLTSLDGQRGAKLELEISASWEGGDTDDWYFAGVVQPIEHPSVPSCVYFRIRWSGTAESYDLFLWTNAQLIANASPYWLDELEAYPPGPLLDVCSTQDRLWAISAEDRLSVLPTKPIVYGIAPEFASELAIRVPAEGGECVAIASLGDKVVVFKERNIYAIFGEPGAADGTGSTVQTPRLVPCDVGCVNANSVVDVGSLGIAFQSERGLTLLGPNLDVQRIGEAVQDTIDGSTDIACAVAVPAETEVRWSIASGDTIVWNYRTNAWSTWDLVVKSACVRDGVYVYLDSTTAPREETPDVWSAGATDALVIRTPWIQVAGKQGVQRVWRIVNLLRHYTGGLVIEVEYDFTSEGESISESHSWSEATLQALSPEQTSFDPTQPKCEALRLTFTEIGTSGIGLKPAPSSGRGFELIGLDLTVGVKKGHFRHLQSDSGKA